MKNTANRLINQKSPYLLQHAHNPVDWFPWSDEAFDKAAKEDKPVFLSIGYSTCHWCHVMEHESFEDNEVAGLMNNVFVSIKVDREERPDIDGIYMTACRMLTGSGGWPLTIIMTPDKKPFFAATYIPKTSRFNRMGMLELIPRISELWKDKREDITRSAAEITEALKKENDNNPKNDISENLLHDSFNAFNESFDSDNGGFGSAPKFPMPHNLMFLLRYWKRYNSEEALHIVETTLHKMRAGGIYDHIGFGFHRYSTDAKWLVPHFEKMLYDQALLAQAYTEAYLVTKDEFYKTTAEEILSYVVRDMTSPKGAFYSAEDADSENEEGKFYLWNEDELNNLLGDDSDLIKKIFNIKKNGNWIDQVTGSMNGTNIIHLKHELKELAVQLDKSETELQNLIASAREKIFNTRAKRAHPYKDDMILTDWNGLMISAFAKAFQAFGNKQYLKSAKRAADFILSNMLTTGGKLLHRYRDGEAALDGLIDDYQFFISALIDLYEASFEISYLEKAITLNDYALAHFWDAETGGFFFAGEENEDLLVRQKEVYDGAVPAGNSIAALNLIRLARVTGSVDYERHTETILKTFSNYIIAAPSAFTQSLIAFDFLLGPSYEFVIAGKKDDAETDLLINEIRSRFIPNKILLLNENKALGNIAPFTADQNMINNLPTLYLCLNYNCTLPVTGIENAKNILTANNL